VEMAVWSARTNSLWTVPVMSKKIDEHSLDLSLHVSCIFLSQWVCTFHSNTLVQLILSSLNARLVIARVSFVLFPRFAQNLMHTCCQVQCKITSDEMRYFK
jgi:hypothetical protein